MVLDVNPVQWCKEGVPALRVLGYLFTSSNPKVSLAVDIAEDHHARMQTRRFTRENPPQAELPRCLSDAMQDPSVCMEANYQLAAKGNPYAYQR